MAIGLSVEANTKDEAGRRVMVQNLRTDRISLDCGAEIPVARGESPEICEITVMTSNRSLVIVQERCHMPPDKVLHWLPAVIVTCFALGRHEPRHLLTSELNCQVPGEKTRLRTRSVSSGP